MQRIIEAGDGRLQKFLLELAELLLGGAHQNQGCTCRNMKKKKHQVLDLTKILH